MRALEARFAHWLLKHRRLAWVFFIAVTVFFAAGLPRVELRTIFSDLLPQDDPFVQTYQDHSNFGNPLTVTLMVRRRQGDIYNADTLHKIWQLTRDLDLAPGVDHDLVFSLASSRARYSEATPWGVDMRPLMADRPPQTVEEVALFRQHVDMSPLTRVFLISRDERAALVSATFIERRLDYGEVFDFVRQLAEAARDEEHEVHVAGQPILIGWVYQYEAQMLLIFAVTLTALLLALALYMRSAAGILTPVVASGVSAIWAFGLVGWLAVPVEPLLMVVPLLLVARAFSHSVQFTERYYEVYEQLRDRRQAAETTLSMMMQPSALGIVTDIIGISVVALAPIPAMWRHALFCGMWAVWLLPIGLALVPLLLASLPPPKDIERFAGTGRNSGMHRLSRKLLGHLANLSVGARAPWTTLAVAVLAVLAVHTALQIRIGNPVEGSNLLWPDSEFNTAVSAINTEFPGVNTLEVVLEARDPESEMWNVARADTVMTMLRLQRLMEQGQQPPRATLSFADYLAEANRLFQGGHPKWLPLDDSDRAVGAAAIAVMMGSSAKNYAHVVDDSLQHATVSLWYRDNKQETVDAALAQARAAIDTVGVEHEHFVVRLGTGTIALQQAVNLVVERFHWIMIGLLNLAMFALSAWAYRSPMAGLLLIVPVNLANQIMNAAMHLLGVGLDVNSLIVAAIGVGVGIDYGIYLLSRIREEYPLHDADWARAITAALRTTGKAILFTATIMIVGILPWYFLSGLKFLADMGLLLVVIMAINMMTALIVLPLLVWWAKPRFVRRGPLLALRPDGASAAASSPPADAPSG